MILPPPPPPAHGNRHLFRGVSRPTAEKIPSRSWLLLRVPNAPRGPKRLLLRSLLCGTLKIRGNSICLFLEPRRGTLLPVPWSPFPIITEIRFADPLETCCGDSQKPRAGYRCGIKSMFSNHTGGLREPSIPNQGGGGRSKLTYSTYLCCSDTR